MVSGNITTGVDKLVEIVSESKKITIEQAAKKLGVGKDVVTEWAEFLEEEGLVTLDYSLSKTWITEKKISKADVIDNAKEISSKKDALARKIDVAINALREETTGFEDVRKEFVNIQEHIKEEITVVKTQLEELDRYDSLRKNLTKDVAQQKQNYELFVNDAQAKLVDESKKYEELKQAIEIERKHLDSYEQKLEELKKLRSDYERTIGSLRSSLNNIDGVMKDLQKRSEDSSSRILSYKKSMEKLTAELSIKKDNLLTKKIQELKNNEDKILRNQQSMETDIKTKISKLQEHSGLADKIHQSFDGYFTKNIETEKLIKKIETDKTDLTNDLEALKKKILGFTLLTNNATIRMELKEIESKISEFEHKKTSIRSNIDKLILLIKGK